MLALAGDPDGACTRPVRTGEALVHVWMAPWVQGVSVKRTLADSGPLRQVREIYLWV